MGARRKDVLWHEDIFKNQHHYGTMGLETIYFLTEKGNEIRFTDSGLPADLSKSFSKEKVNYVDLYNLFKSNDETLYLKKDSHWNGKGALLAYKSIMNKTKLPYDNYSKAKEFIDSLED